MRKSGISRCNGEAATQATGKNFLFFIVECEKGVIPQNDKKLLLLFGTRRKLSLPVVGRCCKINDQSKNSQRTNAPGHHIAYWPQ